MTSMSAYCGNCGAPNLGTRFCETCGSPLGATAPSAPAVVAPVAAALAVAPTQALRSAVAAPSASTAVGGLPLALFLGGVIASAVVSLSAFVIPFGGTGAIVAIDVLTILFDAVSVLGVMLAGLRGSAKQPAMIAGLLIALLAPVLDVIVLILTVTGGYYSGYAFTNVASWPMPLLTTLAWLLATGLPGRSYVSLFISGAAVLLSSLILFGAFGLLSPILGAAGIVVAVLVASRMGGSPALANAAPSAAAGGMSEGGYAAIPRPTSTNSFAVVALIFGLLGGTVLPIVFGHVARSQIRRTGEGGWGMATAGLILGYLSSVAVVIIIIVVAVSAAQAPHYYG